MREPCLINYTCSDALENLHELGNNSALHRSVRPGLVDSPYNTRNAQRKISSPQNL